MSYVIVFGAIEKRRSGMYVRVWLDLEVGVSCEACSHFFKYRYRIRDYGSGWGNPYNYVRSQYMKGEYGVHRCPECKYLQSWMVKQWKDRWRTAMCVISIPVFIVVVKLIGAPWPKRSLDSFVDLVVFTLALGGYLILFSIVAAPYAMATELIHPNRRWHKKNGPDIPPPKSPSVRPVRE